MRKIVSRPERTSTPPVRKAEKAPPVPKAAPPPKPAPPPPPPTSEDVAAAVHAFWAPGPGAGAFAQTERIASLVAAAKLSTSDVLALIPAVPAQATGPVGDRCVRVIKLLERLAA